MRCKIPEALRHLLPRVYLPWAFAVNTLYDLSRQPSNTAEMAGTFAQGISDVADGMTLVGSAH